MREKDPKKEEAIYRAALNLVLEKGFSALKMSAIADRAGLAAGTIYLYFDGKEDMIGKLYLYLTQEGNKASLQGVSSSQSFSEGFQRIWFNALEYTLAYPEVLAYMEQYHRSPYKKVEEAGFTGPLREAFFDLLENGKKEGKVANIATQLLFAQLNGAMIELAKGHQSGALNLDAETRRQAFALAWKTILP